MKWVKRIGLLVILLVIVVVGVLFYYKDAAVKKAVVFGGDTVLGDGTTALDSANLNVFGGGLTLTGLKLDNADGYKQPHFFQLAGTDVKVSLGTLMEEKIVIPTVTLDGLNVVAETSLEQGLPKLNLITIKKTVDASVGGSGGGGDPAPDADAEAGKKFVIDKLTITNMKVTGALTMPGGGSVPVDVPVPSFTITGIGEKDNGVVMKELVAIILDAVLRKAIEQVGNVGGVSLDMFEGGAGALLEGAGGLLEGAGGVGEGVGGAIDGIIGGGGGGGDGEGDGDGGGIGGAIEQGIGGFLGGGNQDDEEQQE